MKIRDKIKDFKINDRERFEDNQFTPDPIDHPQRVSNRLFDQGISPDQIRSFGMQNFRGLCKGLKGNRVPVDKAASEIFCMFNGNRDALEFLYENSGTYGMLALSHYREM